MKICLTLLTQSSCKHSHKIIKVFYRNVQLNVRCIEVFLNQHRVVRQFPDQKLDDLYCRNSTSCTLDIISQGNSCQDTLNPLDFIKNHISKLSFPDVILFPLCYKVQPHWQVLLWVYSRCWIIFHRVNMPHLFILLFPEWKYYNWYFCK